MADRDWVAENTFSGDYNDLINTPSIPGDVSQLSDNFSLLFSGDYNDLTNAPDLESLNVDISTINSIGDVDTETEPLVNGQLLQWDGTKWQNATVEGFEDTNTTYSISSFDVNGDGSLYAIRLTGSDATTVDVPIVAGAGVSITENLSGNIEISAAAQSIDAASDVTITNPQDNQVLKYSSGVWINATAPSAGIALTDLSVTSNPASGSGSLVYNNTNGIFTFTPADFSSVATLANFSVTTDAAQSGGSLTYNNTTGVFTFRPANLSGYAQLSDLSVTTTTASGGGSLSYNNTTGEFTFAPSAGGDIVNDTTPQLGGNLDINGNDITGSGNISITGSVSADSFSSSATGAPSLTSASTITFDAPDGVIVQNGPFRLPSFTTTEKNGLTAVNGDMVYDSTLNKAQVYENGAWVSLV